MDADQQGSVTDALDAAVAALAGTWPPPREMPPVPSYTRQPRSAGARGYRRTARPARQLPAAAGDERQDVTGRPAGQADQAPVRHTSAWWIGAARPVPGTWPPDPSVLPRTLAQLPQSDGAAGQPGGRLE